MFQSCGKPFMPDELKEARPTDVDKEPEFPIGTPMEYEGRRYYYWGPAPKDIGRGEVVIGQAKEGIIKRRGGI